MTSKDVKLPDGVLPMKHSIFYEANRNNLNDEPLEQNNNQNDAPLEDFQSFDEIF